MPTTGKTLPEIYPQRGSFEALVVENVLLCREHYRLTVRTPEFPASYPGNFVQILADKKPGAGENDCELRELEWQLGRPAPKLVSAAMVGSMKPGSVLVDLAVERGGNVEGAQPGKVVTTANGVKIVGHLNVPGRVAASASLLYAKNLYAFLETMVDKANKTLAINREDELVKATMLTDGGKVVHAAFANAAAAVAAAPAAEKPTDKPVKAAAAERPAKAAAAKKPAAKAKPKAAAGSKSGGEA